MNYFEIITIEQYLKQYTQLPLIDVRSPGEYQKGHIKNAVSIPLFSNEERTHIGTVYKQVSKEKAIELGYKYVGPKLDWYINESLKTAPGKEIIVHCWRGGMRSQSFAEHLAKNGFQKVYIIEKGYKAFRNYVLDFFTQDFNLYVLGGFTGSGKTIILNELGRLGEQAIDLEGLANHQGSAFGGIGKGKQPSVEMFENTLFTQLYKLDISKRIWVEDESMNIGRIFIPQSFFKQIRSKTVYFLDIPFEKRARYLLSDYGKLPKDKLAEAICKLTKRLGHQAQGNALNALENDNLLEVSRIMLRYYDKSYLKGLNMRNPKTIKKIICEDVNAVTNARLLLGG
jgi:tRNA 2-selenouridine synthase